MLYIDYSNYDYVFLPKESHIDTMHFSIPVFEYETEHNRESIKKMWDSVFMKKRKSPAITVDFGDPYVCRIKTTVKTIVKDVLTIILSNLNTELQKIYEHYLHNLIFTVEIQPRKDLLFSRSYVIYATEVFDKTHYIIDLVVPIRIGGQKIVTLHFFLLQLNQGAITIKNGDSEIRELTKM